MTTLPPWSWKLKEGWFDDTPDPLRSFAEIIDTPEYRKQTIYPVGQNALSELPANALIEAFSTSTWAILGRAILKLAACGNKYKIPEAKTFLDSTTYSFEREDSPWSLGPPDDVRGIHAFLYAVCPERMAPYGATPPVTWDHKWVANVVDILKHGWCRKVIKQWRRTFEAYTILNIYFEITETWYVTVFVPVIVSLCQAVIEYDFELGDISFNFPGCPPEGNYVTNPPRMCNHQYGGSLTFSRLPDNSVKVTAVLNGPHGTIVKESIGGTASAVSPANICSGEGTPGQWWTNGVLSGYGGSAPPAVDTEKEEPIEYEIAN